MMPAPSEPARAVGHPNARVVSLGGQLVGDGHPVYIVAELGVNHNGDLELAKRLVDAASAAGCGAVKFQKRTPEFCVPSDQRDRVRDTPWGSMTYLEYRHRVEFGWAEYEALHDHCRRLGIAWFASCWDEPSVAFVEGFSPPCHKVPSAAVPDVALLDRLRATGRPIILSTGMSRMEEIRAAARRLEGAHLVLTHSTSSYPCVPEELNLRMIETLRREFPYTVGYSGHEVGLPTTVAAVALGASYIERHLTLDRAMWGSDHAASMEPAGFERLVRYIRTVQEALGDGVKQVYSSELAAMRRLRRRL